jgi:hypothetical protein
MPTVGREPGHWTVPLLNWLWAPAVALVLAVGLGGLRLCWLWALDARAAGTLADQLLRPDPPRPDRDEGVAEAEGPEPSWWTSTAEHMLLRAMAVQGNGNGIDPGRAERVEFLLHAARHASPAQASVRYALARLGRGRAGGAPAGPDPGLSRDVVALAWSGHLRLEAGRTEEALASYRAALEMACRSDLARLDPPAFQEDLQVRRYTLPYEGLIGPVIRDMADTATGPTRPGRRRCRPSRWRRWSRPGCSGSGAAPTPRGPWSGPSPRRRTRPRPASPRRCTGGRGRGPGAAGPVGRGRGSLPAGRRADAPRPDPPLLVGQPGGPLRPAGRRRPTQAAREAAKGPDPAEEITRRVIDAQLHDGVGTSGPAPAAEAPRPDPLSTRP